MLANMISRRGYLWFDYLLLGTVQIEVMRSLSVDAARALGLSRLRLRVGTPCVLYSAGMENLNARASVPGLASSLQNSYIMRE
jgi:hypothetical protein